MPVDRDLAIESLKRIDERLYNMYKNFRELEDYVKEDEKALQKLRLYVLSLNALDHLESLGLVEIINDYKNKIVLVRRNY